MNKINFQTWVKLTPMARGCLISSQANGKYAVTKTEEQNGFFFTIESQGIGINVPFRALFTDNSKTSGIVGICFTSAKECPSHRLGTCQVPKCAKCYAKSGEARATKRFNNGFRGMDSLLNAQMCRTFWNQYQTDADLRNRLFNYLEFKGIHTIRFNLKGDFLNVDDIAIISHLAGQGFHMVGYTARDDLSAELETLGQAEGVTLNGSNRCYTNRFEVTTDLKYYFDARFQCLGSCLACRKCYTLKNARIVCLVHGSGSDSAMNTQSNHKFINFVLKHTHGITIRAEEFGKNKGLITCLNKALASRGIDLAFKNAKDFLKWVELQGGYY